MIKKFCTCIVAGWALATQAAGPPSPVELTAQEKDYIAQTSTITMCVDPDWIPFEHINEQGEHVGIAADLVQLVVRRVGLKIELIPTDTWEESLAASKNGRCQVMSFLNRTPAREQWLIFSEPIFFDPNIIITREEHPYIGDLQGLSNKTVALPRGTMVEERIRREYPNLTPILTDTEQQAVTLVSERKADMTIRSLIVAAYAIRKEGLFNLKIAGHVPNFTNELRIGVVRDDSVLRDILNKGVKTLTSQEREAISNRHVSIAVQHGIDYQLLWKIVAATLAVLVIVFFWLRKLQALNKELKRLAITDRLTGLFNRVKLDEVLAYETLRAKRYGQPFSLMIIDVDHFKQVNDEHGHQAGDRVLIEVAQLLQANTREIDLVGRWGGEEFMVICPHTDNAGVFQLAQNLCTKMQTFSFSIVQHKTASFGVATYHPGDQGETLLARADAALYAAKAGGRNRVVTR